MTLPQKSSNNANAKIKVSKYDSGAISRHDIKRMQKHADLYYDEIRKRTSDVTAISINTGYSENEIMAVKNHLFLEYHDLGRKNPTRFHPDYDISVSWQRLIDGKNIFEMDIVLLKHELCELKLMTEGITYDKAYEIADNKFSYMNFIKILNETEGIV